MIDLKKSYYINVNHHKQHQKKGLMRIIYVSLKDTVKIPDYFFIQTEYFLILMKPKRVIPVLTVPCTPHITYANPQKS